MRDQTPTCGTIHEAEHVLSGYLSIDPTAGLYGEITIPETVSGDDVREHYAPEGDNAYIVKSRADRDQYLNTRNKVMDDDMTIQKIDYSETSNASGGLTCYIA